MWLQIFLLTISFCFVSYVSPQADRTTKGNSLIYKDGFEWRKKNLIAVNQVQVWVCTKKYCPARAHSPVGSENLNILKEHNHLSVNTQNIVRGRKERIKQMARNDPIKAPRNIVGETRAGLDDESLLNMPSTSTASRLISRQRVVPGWQNVDDNDINAIILEGDFVVDRAGHRFLLHDSRQNEPNLPVFLIYATDEGLRKLRRHRHWSADGTFKVVPRNMMQLYTLNVLVDHSSVPCVFIIMQNKQQVSYERAFTVIRNAIGGLAPLSVISDFEMSAKNAFKGVFGEAVPFKHCLFHLGQSVNRKVANDSFKQIYAENENFRKAVRSLTALAFLQIDEVLDAYVVLRENAPQAALPIFNYFQNTYLYRENDGERSVPLFSHFDWNVHDSTIENLQRTNNAIEGWHLAFQHRFIAMHPPFSKLINALKVEEEYQQNRIRPYEIDPTRGLTEKRKMKFVLNDRAIKDLVLRYDNDEERNNEMLLHHLTALQYRLAENGIHEW